MIHDVNNFAPVFKTARTFLVAQIDNSLILVAQIIKKYTTRKVL
ncbi:hypothetical protein SEEM1923_09565 [Salmonella enterica subsp. enterica serovar Miami str. 1923]|nr:hypothetical protein SEEM1923_09565 [Salmonella enterica subsp. enterica serovar Miami str. 1923]SUF74246.1 Uncharacterised protein [Salmonella enterica]